MERPLRIACAAGGTGGHVFPALGIADAVRKARPDTEFLFFGTAGKIEARVVPERGYPFRKIWISGFHRSLRPSNLAFPIKLVVALIQSWISLSAFRPDAVVGTGGYVCGPVLYVASLMGIPTIVHESNSYPGITTRLLAKKADLVLTGFAETIRWLPRGIQAETVGTPVRSFDPAMDREEARRSFGFGADDRVVLVLGGSLGALSINRAIDEGVNRLADAGVRLLWQTGSAHEAHYKNRHEDTRTATIRGFIGDMAGAYMAADLVVSRAGASTLAELALFGRPAILVPYPYAAEQHQMKNARAVEAQGGALVISDGELSHLLITEIIKVMSEAERQEQMAASMGRRARPEAADTIAQRILSHVKSS